MKKLLVLILLLSVASSANSLTVTLEPNGLVAGHLFELGEQDEKGKFISLLAFFDNSLRRRNHYR